MKQIMMNKTLDKLAFIVDKLAFIVFWIDVIIWLVCYINAFIVLPINLLINLLIPLY
jgi:hypothetical protein